MEWIGAAAPDHPARAALAAAQAVSACLGGRRDPVLVSAVDPVLWLASWTAGRPVLWHRGGLRGLAAVRASEFPPPPPATADPVAPALIWAKGPTAWVYSHAAVFEAIAETAGLCACGTGFSGPPAFIQGAAAWILGRPFGKGRFFWPLPGATGVVTDGENRFRCLPELLGPFQEAGEDPTATTRLEDRVRVRSRRLFDGYWTGQDVVPARFLDGWYVLRYPISEV